MYSPSVTFYQLAQEIFFDELVKLDKLPKHYTIISILCKKENLKNKQF